MPQIKDLDGKNVDQELKALRSFMIGMAGKDSEGQYRPEFVQRILKASRDEIVGEFKDAESFLSSIS